MAAHGLDALLVRNRADLCYLTGMETCYMVAYHAAIVPLKGEPILLASDFEMLNALVGAWCQDRVTFAVTADPIAATCRTLEERGFARGRVGVEMGVLSATAFRAMSERLPEANFVDMADAIIAVKLIKSPREIDYLRQAGR